MYPLHELAEAIQQDRLEKANEARLRKMARRSSRGEAGPRPARTTTDRPPVRLDDDTREKVTSPTPSSHCDREDDRLASRAGRHAAGSAAGECALPLRR